MMAASLMVRMQVRRKAPLVVFRRGFCVRGGGLVVSLP
jgi:RNA 3'-terminal phosphate cyclase